MAVVKFVAAKCPMSYIFKYVMRKEATERKLIDGLNCSPVSACDEFEYVKHQYHKEDGRQYYHIVQSFSPDDHVTPERRSDPRLQKQGAHRRQPECVTGRTDRR